MTRYCVVFFFSVFFLISEFDSARAEAFQVIEGAFFWSSSNLAEIQPVQPGRDSKTVRSQETQSLRNQSYKNYFDLHGTHSTYPFLQSIKEGDLSAAGIKYHDGLICSLLKKVGGRNSEVEQMIPR